ncbi:hypothetical protein AB0F03_35540 [Streptomyces sp. NPDC028722]|uniref:hypothetical protein n=1 Tax=Streptomyces sp. NPDC028722 TaxID=3155016 RepID=UPI0033E3577C
MTVDSQDNEARQVIHLTRELHPARLEQAIGRLLSPQGVLLADAQAHPAYAESRCGSAGPGPSGPGSVGGIGHVRR